MNNDIFIPEAGTTCHALINENYETMLSGECNKFCTCAITERQCSGAYIDDSEDASSQFVSRARNHMSNRRLNSCPMYGLSREIYVLAVKERAQKKLEETLSKMSA